eukprot:6186013-Pleurochrysis_carterae.AAC.5
MDDEDCTAKRSHMMKPILIEHPTVALLRRQHEAFGHEFEEKNRIAQIIQKQTALRQQPEGLARSHSMLRENKSATLSCGEHAAEVAYAKDASEGLVSELL